MEKPVIALTAGDPGGIGPEVVIRALGRKAVRERITPVVFADEAVIRQALDLTGVSLEPEQIDIRQLRTVTEDRLLYCPPGILKEPALYGIIDADHGRASRAALSMAIEAALGGQVDALVTGPVHKEAMKLAGCGSPDQTALLADACGMSPDDVETVFVTGNLRIFFLTRHIPLRDVPSFVTHDSLVDAIRRCEKYLRLFGIARPALAVAALNPHGGEGGLFGREEEEIIKPAVAGAQRELLDIRGPVPADCVFHQAAEGKFDGVLSLYHDQGHIAAKTMDFHRTITMTLGLPFLRTSVDHGTAFDIAGKGIAVSVSMERAILAAADQWQSCRIETDAG